MVEQPIGEGVLYVLSTVQSEHEDAFTSWCNDVHHYETMEVEGFMSLRRFERVIDVRIGPPDKHRLLTLYQLATVESASGRSYREHSDSYQPVAPEVVEGISYERAVFAAVDEAEGSRQQVGHMCLSISVPANSAHTTSGGSEALTRLRDAVREIMPDALSSRCFQQVGEESPAPGRGLLLVELAGAEGLERIGSVVEDAIGAENDVRITLYQQRFPEPGNVLLRDRQIAAGP